MKRFLTPLFLAAAFAIASAAHAQTISLEPLVKPLDPALARVTNDTPSAFKIRELSIAAATALLESTEGPAWRVLQVQAPACDNPSSKEKSSRKICRAMKADCMKADSYARSHGQHAACSALYAQTTVLLTNDGSPNQRVKPAKAAPPKKASSPRKAKHKAKPAVRKPAVGTC